MNPCHIDINWTNNQAPAINDTNLGQINTELREIDTRVCSLANDPAGEALVSEGWAEGTQAGVPVTSGSPYYQNNSDYHRLESEGWANGEQDGVPVTSGSPYYENNAKYWKEQAAAIAGQTLSGLTDVNITTPADGQALVYDSNSSEWVNGDVGLQTTNPNILINPWFTVNQRGWSSGSSDSGRYVADRWQSTNSNGTMANSSSGITLTKNSGSTLNVAQTLEDDVWTLLAGKTVTVSLLLTSGTIYNATSTFDGSNNKVFFENSSLILQTNATSKRFIMSVKSGTLAIRAVKLEIGSNSTLHLDTAPDYTTELLKCQRFFRRIGSVTNNGIVCLAFTTSSTNGCAIIPLSTPMRVKPTLSVSGEYKFASYTLSYSSVTVALNSGSDCRDRLILNLVGSGLPSAAGGFLASGTTSYMDFSAEL